MNTSTASHRSAESSQQADQLSRTWVGSRTWLLTVRNDETHLTLCRVLAVRVLCHERLRALRPGRPLSRPAAQQPKRAASTPGNPEDLSPCDCTILCYSKRARRSHIPWLARA